MNGVIPVNLCVDIDMRQESCDADSASDEYAVWQINISVSQSPRSSLMALPNSAKQLGRQGGNQRTY